ncbi:hypothetical protein E2R58_14810 [Paenibacillus amylolyticus]|nr:Imm3 family immunity protein [Paenibacillus amylolyticus]TDL70354.1 hypothetical protein E2R58_14810 [Paenibacillus amylolyticus]
MGASLLFQKISGGIYMHWEYKELFDAVNETYNEFKLENMSGTKALSRTLSEFETTMNLGILKNL